MAFILPFFKADPALFREKYGDKPFIFCAGSITTAKNTLALVKATKDIDIDVVLCGPNPRESKDYLDECLKTGWRSNSSHRGFESGRSDVCVGLCSSEN